MTLPRVTIVMTVYFPEGADGEVRLAAACTAIGSWATNLRYDGELALHIADDGSALVDGRMLLDERRVRYEWETVPIGRYSLRSTPDRPLPAISLSRQERHGVGASLNAGFDVAEANGGIAAMFVDDWKLLAPLDLTPWVQLLEDDATVGMVRLGPPHPWLTGRVEAFPSGWGLRLARHHFAFGHRPALYHPRMREFYGSFDEHVNAYDCERLYADRWAWGAQYGKRDWPQTVEPYQIPAEDAPWPTRHGPDIVLALPTLWEHIDSVELAGIDPRG